MSPFEIGFCKRAAEVINENTDKSKSSGRFLSALGGNFLGGSILLPPLARILTSPAWTKNINDPKSTPEIRAALERQLGLSGKINYNSVTPEVKGSASFIPRDNAITKIPGLPKELYAEVDKALKRYHGGDLKPEHIGTILGSDRELTNSTVAHELGHGSIENKPGFLRNVQNYGRFGEALLSPGIAFGGTYLANQQNEDIGQGVLSGAAIGAASRPSTLLTEFEASRRALSALGKSGVGGRRAAITKLAPAFLTYLASATLPTAFQGGAMAWNNKHQHKKFTNLKNNLKKSVS